jgi:putative hemolysin
MIEIWQIIVLVICFFGSAFFSGSEAVLMSIGIDRAKQLIEEGGRKGKTMTFMVERPNGLLATILVGNNITNILAASLTTMIFSAQFGSKAIGIATGVTTILILIFGEVIPKTFARVHAESLAVPVVGILKVLYYLLFPLVITMTWITKQVLGENAQLSGRMVTKTDIEYLVNRAEKENTMDSKQLDLLSSILEFPTIKVKDIMIVRSQVKFIENDWSFNKVLDYVGKDTHSRYPVCKESLDHILGFLHVKDLAFIPADERESFEINKHLKDPFFVYEHMKIQAVFDHMNRKKVHLALVKDENGLVVGIITLEDIIEEILGEIQDEHDKEKAELTEHGLLEATEEGISVSGAMNLRDLHSDYDIKIPPHDNYSTLAGFILDMLGNNFPEEGQIIVWEGLSFQLTEVKSQEIKEVKITDVQGEKHLFSKSDTEAHESSEENGEKPKPVDGNVKVSH